MTEDARQLRGHGLAYEGAPHNAHGVRISTSTRGSGHGKCSCGELSDDLSSGSARKVWHREHKATIRATQEQP